LAATGELTGELTDLCYGLGSLCKLKAGILVYVTLCKLKAGSFIVLVVECGY
jgi:hypothetical protein